MSILDRFILSLYTFCLAVILLFIVLIAANIVPYAVVNTYADTIFRNSEYSTIAIVVAVIFLLVSLRFLLSGTGKIKSKSAIEKTSQLGTIAISLNSIESIVMSAIKQMDGVMDLKIDLFNNKDVVAIKLTAIVTPERSIPELSAIIQARAKEAVETIAGVGVSSVEVLVEDIVQTIRPSVRNRVE